MASIATQIGDAISTLTGSGGSSGATAPPGSPYSTIYAFGDSLTDAGNISIATAGQIPISPPYSEGRFTNGPVWVQDLAQNLGVPSMKPSLGGGSDFAYGASDTGSTPAAGNTPLDLNYQFTQFQLQNPDPAPGALYAIWTGSNDVRDAASQPDGSALATVDAAVSNEMKFIGDIVGDGARNLLVLNVPDIGRAPDEANNPSATPLSSYYDAQLSLQLGMFGMTHPGVAITQVDTFGLLNQAIANPAAFGFTNVTTPLWSGNLTDPNSGTLATTDPAAQAGYLFFDGLHPSQQAHALVAAAAQQALGLG